MTLHEAIEKVLIDSQTSLTTREIADRLNEKGIYQRKDRTLVTSSQVSARVANYKDQFIIDSAGNVSITDKNIKIFNIAYEELGKLLSWSSALDSTDIQLLRFTLLFAAKNLAIEGANISELDADEFLNKVVESLPFNVQMFPEYRQLKHNIEQFNSRLKSEICSTLFQLQKYITNEEVYGTFFSDILNSYTSGNAVNHGLTSTPIALSKFIATFYDLPFRGNIFDPFAGNGSSLVETYKYNLDKKPHVVAGDINSTSCFLGNLNLFINNCPNIAYANVDAYSGWNENMRADLIITNPPFNNRIPPSAFWRMPHIEKLFHEIFNYNGVNYLDSQTASVLFALGHLKDDGKAILLIPEGLLFGARKDYQYLRSYLVDNKVVAGVILLPQGAFKPYANISTIALLIDKSNKNDKLFLYDASTQSTDYFEKNYSKIKEAYNNNAVLTDVCTWVSYSDINSSTYDLSPKRFLVERLTGSDYKTIKDIAKTVRTGTVIPKVNLNRRSGIPFIQVGNLVDSEGLNEIDNNVADYYVSEIDEVSQDPPYLKDNSILISKVGAKLKATLYKDIGNALCNPNIIVIEVNEQQISPEYLITQLQSDYVLGQINAIRHNIGVPHFSKGDFLSVKIKLVPLNEQGEFVAKFYGKRLKEEIIHSERQLDDELYNIIAALKHELHQPISSIGMDVPNLYKYLDEKISSKKLLNWDEPVVELLPGEELTDDDESILKFVLKRIIACAEKAKATLQKAEQTLNIGKGTLNPELIEIKSLLFDSIIPHYQNANCIIHVKGGELHIMADKYQIEVLFNRLIENAIKHGFINGSNKKDNIINIVLKDKGAVKQYHEIIVENNGKPFPDGFDIEKFQTTGQTSNRRKGSGFGGFHIQRIIDNHKGEIRIDTIKDSHSSSEFKVRFKIYLP